MYVWKFKLSALFIYKQLGGAAEACWAHNPEVGGSKPLQATLFYQLVYLLLCVLIVNIKYVLAY